MTEKFKMVKFHIDRALLFEMKMNRIGSMTIFNRKPTKEPEVVDNVHDDSEEVVEKKPMQIVREIPMDEETLDETRKWYESLYFRWSQVEDAITISWT